MNSTGRFLTLLCAGALSTVCAFGQALEWFDAETIGVEGRAWADESIQYYDRLPAEAQKRVNRAVWALSQDSSGMAVAFTTDSDIVDVRWTVRKPELAMAHMAATGVSGIDAYIRDSESGQWRWAAVGRPQGAAGKTSFSTRLVGGLPRGIERDFLVYLPLYNGIESLKIGVVPGSEIRPLNRQKAPIVFYGTSITQGACASRPGMAYPAILGRQLDVPIVNLGFSGNGRMEEAVMAYVAQIDRVSAFVLDALPNMWAKDIQRWEAAIKMIRRKHPDTPIVLVPSVEYANGWVSPAAKIRCDDSNNALRHLYEKLRGSDPHLYLANEGRALLSDQWDSSVDGTHPTDLGHMQIARNLEPLLREALASEAGGR